MSRLFYGQAGLAALVTTPTTPEARGSMLIKRAVGVPTAEFNDRILRFLPHHICFNWNGMFLMRAMTARGTEWQF
jgi:hypothetical protein